VPKYPARHLFLGLAYFYTKTFYTNIYPNINVILKYFMLKYYIFLVHIELGWQCDFPLVISNTEDICLDIYVHTAHIHAQYNRTGTTVAFVRFAQC